jgi:multidrug resistance protein MdtO
MMPTAEFLRSELASKPGRLGNVLRMTVFTLLVVIISETYRIPLTADSAYLVFFISKEDSGTTIFLGIALTFIITLAVFGSLGLYTISAGEPGLRLPLMALVTFGAMFISRASPLGVIGFVTGFLITLSLTLIDVIPVNAPHSSADLLTRAVLWLWVVAMLPASVVIMGNYFFGRKPLDMFRDEIIARCELMARLLRHPDKYDRKEKEQLEEWNRLGTGPLLKSLKMASMFQKRLSGKNAGYKKILAQTELLKAYVSEWMELGVSDTASHLRTKIFGLIEIVSTALLSAQSTETSQPSAKVKTKTKKRRAELLMPDAFTNPDYVRFALKTTLSIFIAYISYNLMDWSGIRTCMITCFFVALGSYGETAHKMTLRMTGALIGGALGLGTVIFVMPHLTSITGLCVVFGVVCFLAAWVATSSERLAYAGLQIAIAFFFSTLVGFGPSIELSEARDRVVGILFGNFIISIVFSNLWPVSALAQAKKQVGIALKKLSEIISATPENQEDLLFAFDGALTQARHFAALGPFEHGPMMLSGKMAFDRRSIDAVQALYAPLMVLRRADGTSQLPLQYRLDLSSWLSLAGNRVPPDVTFLLYEVSAPIEAEWIRLFDQRVQMLDVLLKTSSGSEAVAETRDFREARGAA